VNIATRGSLKKVTYRHLRRTYIRSRTQGVVMAKNTGEGSRIGSVKQRSQTTAPSGNPVKRDTTSGQFIDQKKDQEPFKGVAKEPDGRKKQ
jgi:hypothetical protein